MGKDYEFLEEENVLILNLSFNSRTQVPQKEIYEKAHMEMMDLIVKYRYPNVLSDCRGLKMDFSLTSIIYKTDMWKRLRMSKNVKVAVVLDTIDDATKLRESRLLSYGYKVKGFTDWTKAKKWLKE